MKLIYNKVYIPIEEKQFILVNTLNGRIDLIDNETYYTLKEWELSENIIPNEKKQIELLNTLKAHGFIVSDKFEEDKIKEELLSVLREGHNKIKKSYYLLSFILTYDCNFRCNYCYEANGITCKSTLTHEMIDAAFDLTNEHLSVIGLFGGEPLLPKNKDAIEYIINKGKDKKFNIITNGYYLLEYFDLLKDLRIDKIQVTLDGTREQHNKNRPLANGNETFDKIYKGIEKYLTNGKHIHIRMNVNQENLESCKDLRQHFLDNFSDFHNNISFEFFPIMQLSQNNRLNLLKDISKTDIDKTEKDLSMINSISGTYKPIIRYFLNGRRLSPVYCFCHAHGGGIYVDPLGDIYSCIVSVGKKELSIGKYFPDKYIKENSIINRNIESIPECRECNYALLCGGGCPLELNSYEDVMKPCCGKIIDDINTLVPYLYKMKRV